GGTNSNLTINAGSGAVTFNDAVGNLSPLGFLVLNGTGTATINGGSVKTSGLQTYNNPVMLGADTVFTTTNSALNFASSIGNTGTARNLTINAGSGAITLGGTVGSGTALGDIALNSTSTTTLGNTLNAASLITNVGGTIAINGGNIITSGAQTYNDAVTLGAITNLTSTGSGNINLANTINGGYALTLNTSGTTTLGGLIGSSTPLTSLTTDAGGTTIINGGNVTTNGSQIYNDAVTLGVATTLTSNSFGNITFADTLNGPFDLSLQAPGTTTFGGVVGGIDPLKSLTTSLFGTLAINTSAIKTTGTQFYQNTVATLGAGATLTSTNGGNITFLSTINGAHDLTLNTAGTMRPNAVGTTMPLTSLTLGGGGDISLTQNITTSGAQNYNGAITLHSNPVVLTTMNSPVSFASTINNGGGLSGLRIDTGSGAITLNGAVGNISALGTFELNGTGTATIAGGSVTTSGVQSYSNPVALGADTLFTTTNSDVSFASSITNAAAHALTINAGSGAITLGGAVGSGMALDAITLNSIGTTTLGNLLNAASLTTNAGGTLVINGGSVTTSGAQTYNDALTLGAITHLTSTGSGNINLANTVNGSYALTLNTSGMTTLGNTLNIASLITDTGGTTVMNGGSVITSGTQTYNDAVTLGAETVLTSNGGGNINLLNTVNGAFGLNLNTSGTTTLGGIIGGSIALTSLTTDVSGTTAINGGAVTTSGEQTYNDNITLGASPVLTSNADNITLNGALVGGTQSLTLVGGVSGDHLFTLNDITSLGTLTVNGNSAVTNTLALLTGNGTTTWTVTNNGGSGGSNGTIAATNIANGGFSNIQNLMGGTAINNFIFNNGAAISGDIIGGGSGANNTLDFSGYLAPMRISLSVPSSGNEFRAGVVVDGAGAPIINSFAQIGSVVGSTTGQSVLAVPNKVDVVITYTNLAQTSGYINDPFYFSNTVVEYTPPTPPSSPAPVVDSEEFAAMVGVASPTTFASASVSNSMSNSTSISVSSDSGSASDSDSDSGSDSSNGDSATTSSDIAAVTNPVTLNLNEITQQQVSLDTQLYRALTVGCF
ncbi:MAG: hypothetical protein K0R24_1374, partial [Gammaproteobacteria bacterium]|nr:hypothetical protein [Gammaproteobacteria bacterium]